MATIQLQAGETSGEVIEWVFFEGYWKVAQHKELVL